MTLKRWVGIDEAGYGPNLGPLVMTAVVAEATGPAGTVDRRNLDLWNDRAAFIARAGDSSGRLWVDDSKAVLRHPSGRDHLEATCRAVLAAACASVDSPVPGSLSQILAAVGAGSLDEVELTPWLDGAETPVEPERESVPADAFQAEGWHITQVRSAVVGPARFNAALGVAGSKAAVHFDVFVELLDAIWKTAQDGEETWVRSDKHGGRHFYYDGLIGAFPETWIDRGLEGPSLSRYTVRDRDRGRRLELSFEPRADAVDGLVALASIVSKFLRERWMDHFNAYWMSRIAGLKRTAGYPVDAWRFREAIEPECRARGLDPAVWWRLK